MTRPALPILETIDHGGCSWQVIATRAEEFERSVLPALERRDSSFLTLKENRHRTLFFHPQGRLFVKHHHPGRWTYRRRQWLEGRRGQREWENIHALEQLGLEVPLAVAWGSCTDSPDSYFVSAQIEAAESLLDFLRAAPPGPARGSILSSLAQQLAAAHEAGWRLPDLHGENLLVSGNRLFFVDFHSARQTLAGRSHRADSWGRLLASIGHLITPEERDELLEDYLRRFGDPNAGAFRKQSWAAESARLRERYRKALRRCLPIPAATPGSRNIRALVSNPPDGVSLQDLLAAGAVPAERILKRGPRAEVSLCLLAEQPLVRKIYRDHNFKGRVRGWTGNSRAEGAFRALAGLQACHVPSPVPVACFAGDELNGDVLWTGFLAAGVRLDDLLAGSRQKVSEKQRRQLAGLAGKLVGRLHRLAIRHPDLTPQNFLVRLDPELQLFLVDFDGVGLKGRLPLRLRILNLAQLYDLHLGMSRAMVSAFLRSYLRESGLAWPDRSLRRVLRAARLRQLRSCRFDSRGGVA